MMITFVKQSMLASNYRDGNGDLDTWLTSREKQYAVKERPSLIEYCDYIYPLASCVIGPSFEYKDWNEFINLKDSYKSMPKNTHFGPAFTRLF